MKKRLTVKFNGGNLAILCDNCRRIIKTGSHFTDEEIAFAKGEGELPPQLCYECAPREEAPAEKLMVKKKESE